MAWYGMAGVWQGYGREQFSLTTQQVKMTANAPEKDSCKEVSDFSYRQQDDGLMQHCVRTACLFSARRLSLAFPGEAAETGDPDDEQSKSGAPCPVFHF